MNTRLRVIALVLLGAVACSSWLGCRGALITGYYLFKGMNDDADFPGLTKKTVVVVCKPLISLEYRNVHVTHDLSQQVSELLRDNVKKITVVDQRKVNKWIDENKWEDYTEVGRALKADMVVGVDLESFSLFQGQILYQGKANTIVHVYDCQTGKEVFARTMPPTMYPRDTFVPTSEMAESEFRRKFVSILSRHVAEHFYAHDRNTDVALDAETLRSK